MGNVLAPLMDMMDKDQDDKAYKIENVVKHKLCEGVGVVCRCGV